jgi:hypothetical protein
MTRIRIESPKYPRRIETPRWECSDGRAFFSEEEAHAWERILGVAGVVYDNSTLNKEESQDLARILLEHYALTPRKAPTP